MSQAHGCASSTTAMDKADWLRRWTSSYPPRITELLEVQDRPLPAAFLRAAHGTAPPAVAPDRTRLVADEVSDLVVVDLIDSGVGWWPIKRMIAQLCAQFAAEHVELHALPGFLERAAFRLPRPARRSSAPALLIVTADLRSFGRLSAWAGLRRAYRHVSAWVIDSFWTEPLEQRKGLHHVDHLFICSGHDVDEYRRKTGLPVSYLPWGADVLGVSWPEDAAQQDRPIDLLRVGRQPASWDDDERNAAVLEAEGVAYHGRPPREDGPERAYALLRDDYLRRSKFVLAQSNRADRSAYTHRTKEYVTARWTDALAYGTTVLGVQPRSDYAFQDLLWDGAYVDLETPDRDAELPRVVDEIRAWTPERAAHNQRMALQKLDWRWRFQQIGAHFGLRSPELDADLAEIRRRTA